MFTLADPEFPPDFCEVFAVPGPSSEILQAGPMPSMQITLPRVFRPFIQQ